MIRLSKLALALLGMALLLGGGRSWAGQPPCATSDGTSSTACGTDALDDNTVGEYNTAIGAAALQGNVTGNYNTASGAGALNVNTSGSFNTATGTNALLGNTTGGDNTASGYQALYGNTTGDYNTASGFEALFSNTTGINNTAGGYRALYRNGAGYGNAAVGVDALDRNTIGFRNTALGSGAGGANTTGSYNTFIGYAATAKVGNYTNGTALGNGATLTASNSIVLGNTAVSKIYAHVSSITAISDRREKKDIAPLDPSLGLAFVATLKPVSYRFRNGDETERYGFIAQDLEQALPAKLHDMVEKSQPDHGLALIERQNDQARTYRAAYGELTAPMVKAIQQQQQEIAGLRQALNDRDAHVAALEGRLAHLEAAMARLAQGKPVRETEAVAPPGHRRSAASSTAMAAKGWEN